MSFLLKKMLPKATQQTTLELRHIVADGINLFDKYPIWREDHREELNAKIINHYYFRQIGFESVGRFRFELNARLKEIMPLYIELYKTTMFEYNPIENYNMQEEFKTSSQGFEDSKTLANGTNVNKFSDTPHSRVENMKDGYLTTHTEDTNNSDVNNTSTQERTEINTGKRRGNIGVTSTQQLIQQERDLIINIDKMIIGELTDLFLGVY